MKEDKLLNEIKSAAENAETRDFPGMEKVWQRVEDKLDKKEDKKAIWRWKKIAVAASLLLVATLGYQFFKSDTDEIQTNQTLTVNDTVQKIIPENALVSSEPSNPAIKKDAEKILQQQIAVAPSVAIADVKSEVANKNIADSITPSYLGYSSMPAPLKDEESINENSKFKIEKDDAKDVEIFVDKSAKKAVPQKEEPLVVINNKVEKRALEEIAFENNDSLVVLKEPLYIINGVEYTEQEVFGPNPTSPYTPLNKQKIESISVLQDEKAIELYGKKGRKGVVVITTKNGKPISIPKKTK